jgi:hypothetical protein
MHGCAGAVSLLCRLDPSRWRSRGWWREIRWPVGAGLGLFPVCRDADLQLGGRFGGLAVINGSGDRFEHWCREGRRVCPVSGGQDRGA